MKISAIKKSIALGVLALLGFAGCTDRDQKPQPEKPTAPETPSKKDAKPDFSPLSPRLKPGDAIVRVNGVDITKADYDRWLNLKGRLFRLRKRKPLSGSEDEEADRFMRNSAVAAIGDLIRRELVRQAASKAGVTASPELVHERESAVLENLRRPNVKFKDICKKLGPVYGPALMATVDASALEFAYLMHWSTNNLTVVTDSELEEQKKRSAETLKTIAENNAKAREAALAARREILEGGRMFADVAKERAELCPEQGTEWEVFELAEFDASHPLARWLATADTGDISEPLDLDDGLAIVGVLAKTEGESSERPGEMVDMYECVRILFKAYDAPEVPETDDEWRDEMLDYRKREAIKALGRELTEAAMIEFPNGQQIFNVKKPRRARQKQKQRRQEKKKGKE